MNNYNFLNLSTFEFELLIRDLLQKKLNLQLENFTSGKDSGIDLRYSKDYKNTLIIQCKRYSNFSDLKKNLVIEANKVKGMLPNRYIIATSIGLTPHQKKTIKDILFPYIKNFEDIIGKEEINNLLSKYKEIEKQHFKLWLSSVNVLETILHSNILTQTEFEKSQIEKDVRTYVINDSFNEALEILKKNHFIIISGIPGIGKTTLAHVLIYNLLANNFKEFINSSESIDESYKLFKENTKQVFLYDDFLGRTLLDNPFQKNEDKRIINFVDKIKNVEDKVLILTTREYILNQALNKSELLSSDNFNISKYILDLSKYTRSVKSKILYNHIFFSDLSKQHIENIIKDKGYIKIIDHKNYSPRIIQLVTGVKSIWKNINPKEFTDKAISLLDNPETVWKHAFENQISELSRTILVIIILSGSPILYENLVLSLQIVSNKIDRFQIRKSLKELENTFIKISSTKNYTAINFFNPSINDFLLYYINRNIDLVYDFLKKTIFINDFFNIFSYKILSNFDKRILGPKTLKKIVVDRLIENFENFRNSKIELYSNTEKSKVILSNTKLIIDNIDIEERDLKNKIVNSLKSIDLNILTGIYLTYYIDILEVLGIINEINIDETLNQIYENLEGGDLIEFARLKKYFSKEFDSFILSKQKNDLIDKCLSYVDYCPNENLETYRDDLDSIAVIYDIETNEIEEGINNKIAELDEYLSQLADDDSYTPTSQNNNIEDLAIQSMFDSLKDINQ